MIFYNWEHKKKDMGKVLIGKPFINLNFQFSEIINFFHGKTLKNSLGKKKREKNILYSPFNICLFFFPRRWRRHFFVCFYKNKITPRTFLCTVLFSWRIFQVKGHHFFFFFEYLEYTGYSSKHLTCIKPIGQALL